MVEYNRIERRSPDFSPGRRIGARLFRQREFSICCCENASNQQSFADQSPLPDPLENHQHLFWSPRRRPQRHWLVTVERVANSQGVILELVDAVNAAKR